LVNRREQLTPDAEQSELELGTELMSKDRSPTDYLSDSWGMDPPGGTNASGAGETPDYPAPSVPYNQDAPLNEEWGMLRKGDGGFGHSAQVEETKGATWGMDKDEIAQGFERPKSDGEGGVLETRQPGGSWPQAIPENYKGPGYDRGAGAETRAREFSNSEGRGFDGRGQPESTSNPGGQSLGSRANQG
jgi:hypothetical protein